MIQRHIQLHTYRSPARTADAALLFVHGGYVDSTCWEHNFIPFFQRHGYDCFAVDLSGHGASGGREQIHEFGIDDYAEDVAVAVERIGGPVIVIGHSMGSLVIERFLERGDAAAAVFLAPVPITGTLGSALQLAVRYPSFFQAIEDITNLRISEEVASVMTEVYFAPGTSPEATLSFMAMVSAESQRAVAEMAMLPARPPRPRRKMRALVAGGTRDIVFPPSNLHFSAFPWGADVHRIDGAGHMLMLDPQWEAAARHILGWLDRER